MAHQCVKCGKIYESAAPELLKGCSCGCRYFFFFKKEDIEMQKQTLELTPSEREEIVKDIKEIVGPEIERPIILDLERIKDSTET